MAKFILQIDQMTTNEFCKDYNYPLLFFTGNIKYLTDSILEVDAIKHKMFVEYAKFLAKDISIELITNHLGFVEVDVRGGQRKFNFKSESSGTHTIIKDEFGFWFEQSGSSDGRRIHKVENVVDYGFCYTDN